MLGSSTGRLLHSLLMLVALLASYWVYRRNRERLDLTNDHKRFLSLAALLGAFVGAKLPFVIESDWSGLSPWIHWLSDGKTVLGGIFGGYIAVELTKAFLGIRQRTGDSYAVPVAIGLSIGRIGCFFGGCCYGTPTLLPWGVAFATAPDRGEYFRHPTQIYEALFHGLSIVILIFIEYRGWYNGQRLKLYLLAYLIFRFFTEFIRPEPILVLGLTAYQIACLLFALLLAVQFYWHARHSS